jgi:hypothetical protein
MSVFVVFQVYKELERGRNLDYWNDITVIVEDELHKLRKLEKQSAYEAGTTPDHSQVYSVLCIIGVCQRWLVISFIYF